MQWFKVAQLEMISGAAERFHYLSLSTPITPTTVSHQFPRPESRADSTAKSCAGVELCSGGPESRERNWGKMAGLESINLGDVKTATDLPEYRRSFALTATTSKA